MTSEPTWRRNVAMIMAGAALATSITTLVMGEIDEHSMRDALRNQQRIDHRVSWANAAEAVVNTRENLNYCGNQDLFRSNVALYKTKIEEKRMAYKRLEQDGSQTLTDAADAFDRLLTSEPDKRASDVGTLNLPDNSSENSGCGRVNAEQRRLSAQLEAALKSFEAVRQQD